MAWLISRRYQQIVHKQRRVMAMKASYGFRLGALCAIDNTVSEQWWGSMGYESII